MSKQQQTIFSHLKKPTFSSCAYTYEGPQRWELFLDISKQNIIKECHYTGPRDSFWAPYFEIFCHLSQGLNAQEIRLLTWEDMMGQLTDLAFESSCWEEIMQEMMSLSWVDLPLVCLPQWMAITAIKDYQGRILPHCQYQRQASDTLLCRCFGLYSGQIEDFVQDNPQGSLLDLTAKTYAGAGCGSCLDDLEDSFQKVQALIGQAPGSEEKDFKILGLYQARWLVLLDQYFTAKFGPKKIEIIELNGFCLGLKIKGPSSLSCKEDWQQHLLEEFKVKFKVELY